MNKCCVDHAAYAIAEFLRRLGREGYIRHDRLNEYLERARNYQHGRGFITDTERRKRRDTEDLLA